MSSLSFARSIFVWVGDELALAGTGRKMQGLKEIRQSSKYVKKALILDKHRGSLAPWI